MDDLKQKLADIEAKLKVIREFYDQYLQRADNYDGNNPNKYRRRVPKWVDVEFTRLVRQKDKLEQELDKLQRG